MAIEMKDLSLIKMIVTNF